MHERLLSRLAMLPAVDDFPALLDIGIFYGQAQSVGRIQVLRVQADDKCRGAEKAVLDSGNLKMAGGGWVIHNLPPGMIRNEQWAEILVKLHWRRTIIRWVTAIRPYLSETFKTPVNPLDRRFLRIFAANCEDQEDSPQFFKKYILGLCKPNTTLWY